MRTFVKILRENQPYLWTAAVLLFGSSVLGYVYHDEVKPLVMEALERIEGIVQSLEENPTYWNTFSMIFLNNLQATFVMLLSGFFFAIFPTFSLLLNGFMLGYVLYDAALQYDVHPLRLFVLQILPHGVMEFPAIIIAGGFGLKFGWLVIRGIGAIWNKRGRKKVGKQFRRSFRQLPLVFFGIIVLLLLAALIESGLIMFVQGQM